MSWLPFRHRAVDMEEVIRTTLRHYGVDDPCEYAWFAMALRELLPQWGIK